MAKAKSKIVAGLEEASEYSRIHAAIIQWIRDDAPVTVKMNLTPAHVSKLIDRIVGSKTHSAT